MSNPISPEAVLAAVEEVMLRPFEWGPCDCCSAACDVFARLWGFDPMKPVRGYLGPRQAVGVIGGDLEALADRLAAEARLIPGHQTGGLALSTDGRSLLICITPGQWAGKTRRGFALLRSAAKGWHA